MIDTFSLLQKYTGISKYSQSEVITPQNIVKDMVDLLPQEVFNPDATFFDPAVKSGRFLIEIYNRLMTSPLLAHIPEQDRHSHIIEKQLFGFATSTTAATVVRKALYNDPTIVGNIHFTSGKITKESVQGAFNNMKFDVVIGNPPYNNDIYLDFVILGHSLASQYTVMITPAKWQAKGGDKNEYFRKHIVPYMSNIVYYTDATDIFSIDIAGGITYYSIQKEISDHVKITCGGRSELLSNWVPSMGSDLDYIGIVEKIIGHPEFRSITNASDKRFIPVKSYFTSKNFGDVYEDLSGKYCMWSSVRCIKVPDDTFKNLSDIGKYKVYCNHNINNKPHPHILGPNVAAVRESCLMGFGTEAECNSIASYYSCRLIWYLAYGMKLGNICTEAFKWVPDPGAFDHIFTDAELYKKYGLTPDEINIIESVIKERK